MTNDNKRTYALARQIEYVGKLAEFAVTLPTHQRVNVFARLHNWARSYDNQFQIEDQIDESRFIAYMRFEFRVNRPNTDPRPTRYWYVYHESALYEGSAIESQSESDAINCAIDHFLDMEEGFSRRQARRIKWEFRHTGKSCGVRIEEIDKDQYLEINSE